MYFLPENDYPYKQHEKITTYLMLSKAKCPVFRSVVIEDVEEIKEEDIIKIQDHLQSTSCTVRYQYIVPNNNPIKGGNKVKIEINELKKARVEGTFLWILSPIDRTKNLYGINTCVNKELKKITMEIVGKGFDVSDINRGLITPHQIIEFEYPFRFGWYKEWWKYIKIESIDNEKFDNSKLIRLQRLKRMGLKVNNSIFDNDYKRISFDILEKLVYSVNSVIEEFCDSAIMVISSSVDDNGKLIFWDIQTPKGKMNILGGVLK